MKKLQAEGFNMNLGKLPPQNTPCEELILGTLLQFSENAQVNAIIQILQPEHFYKDAHHEIFRAIKELYNDRKSIDLITVTSQLKKNETLETVGGAYYLSMLTGRISSHFHLQDHCLIIVQEYTKRELIRTSGDILRESYDDSTDESKLIQKAVTSIQQVHDDVNAVIKQLYNQAESGLNQALAIEVQHIEDDLKKGTIPGVSYGSKAIDSTNGKMHPGDLIIIAARPSMGKSILACNIALHNAIIENLPVDFYSLEMPMARLMHRILHAATGISSEKIASRDLSPADMARIKESIKRYNNNLHIYTLAGDTFSEKISVKVIDGNLRKRKAKLGIIDYLQLMETEEAKKSFGSNREQEVAGISRGLKRTAMKHGIPIIALSQLSRKVEDRTKDDFRPKLSDLRESGAIEQDADSVMFLYRPKYYDRQNEGDPENMTEVITEKNRNGLKSTIPLLFNTDTLSFEDMEKDPADLFNQNHEDIPF